VARWPDPARPTPGRQALPAETILVLDEMLPRGENCALLPLGARRGRSSHKYRPGELKLNRLFTYSDQIRRTALLLLLLGLGACNQGPVTACVTQQTTCELDKAYSQTGTDCHCGDQKGVAVTR
jgi:hypothetical protein